MITGFVVDSFQLLVLTLFVCYIHGVPLTKPAAIGMQIFLTIIRFNLHRKQNPFRITPKLARNACNFDELSKKPYINISPLTTPSTEFQCLDHVIYSRKLKEEQARKSKQISPKDRLTRLRTKMDGTQNVLYESNHTLTNIKYDELTDENIKCHWISYDIDLNPKSIQNSKGIIIGIHGGAYIAGAPFMQHSIASLLRYDLSPIGFSERCVCTISECICIMFCF